MKIEYKDEITIKVACEEFIGQALKKKNPLMSSIECNAKAKVLFSNPDCIFEFFDEEERKQIIQELKKLGAEVF